MTWQRRGSRKQRTKKHTGARIKLGYLYMVGRGVHKDAEAGYGWILAASLAGDARGGEYFSALRGQLNAEQLEQATRRAQELQVVQQGAVTETAFVR